MYIFSFLKTIFCPSVWDLSCHMIKLQGFIFRQIGGAQRKNNPRREAETTWMKWVLGVVHLI